VTALLSRTPAEEHRRGGWRASWAGLARRNWLAVILLAAGLALRVLAQVSYRPALFYIDTARYLYDAQGMDPVGYKGPLRAILFVANFGAVAAIQHLLGLAMAVVIYVLLVRRGVSRWLAALAIAPVLLDAYQVQSEQAIMPGTWFEALIVAGLAILLWQPRASWRAVVAGGIVLGTSATFAQVGEALILPAAIYLLVAGGGWRQAVGKAAALCAAFALPILAYCTGSFLITGDFFLSHSGVTSFYGRMAAAADCATLRLPSAERGMCPSPAQQALGPDWLEYGDGSPIRPYYSNLPRDETDRLIADFDRRVLTQQPQRVAAAYGRDAAKVFALTRTTSRDDTPISRWQFQTAYPYYPPRPHRTSPPSQIWLHGLISGPLAPKGMVSPMIQKSSRMPSTTILSSMSRKAGTGSRPPSGSRPTRRQHGLLTKHTQYVKPNIAVTKESLPCLGNLRPIDKRSSTGTILDNRVSSIDIKI